MICSAYFGELSEERKNDWKCEDDNPYNVLQNPVNLGRKAYDLWYSSKKYFEEQIQIDWASYAWKCTEAQIVSFFEETMTTLPWLVEDEKEILENVGQYIKNHGNTEYGVVFIEES